jgi:hypothetical protein
MLRRRLTRPTSEVARQSLPPTATGETARAEREA